MTHVGIIHIEEAHSFPLIDTIERVAAGLGVSPGWLAFGHQGNEPFRDRRPRSPVPHDDPEPDDRWRAYLARCGGLPGRLRESREASGLSVRALARAASVSHQTWLNVEQGKGSPRVDIVERMAVALGVAAAWLAYGYDADVVESAARSSSAARS